jgi:hypothetical protein
MQSALTTRFYTLFRRGEGRVWDLDAQRIFPALRLKILMSGAKNRRQTLRSRTPATPGEGVNLLLSAFALPSEKIDSLKSLLYPLSKIQLWERLFVPLFDIHLWERLFLPLSHIFLWERAG